MAANKTFKMAAKTEKIKKSQNCSKCIKNGFKVFFAKFEAILKSKMAAKTFKMAAKTWEIKKSQNCSKCVENWFKVFFPNLKPF